MKDILILGAGLAGLSLAHRLAKEGVKITLLEKREEYLNDRTWCFWNTHSHEFEHLIEHRWNKWQIGHNGKRDSYSSPGYEYQMISSLKFYQEMNRSLQSFENVSFLKGISVDNIIFHKTHLEVITSQGRFESKKVYDSRPAPLKSSLYQHFFGWHIRVNRPSFDPSEVVLMDFEGDQSKGIHFMYLLPFSPYEALIEPTFLSANPLEKIDYELRLKEYLASRFGISAFEIIREEKGILPLTTQFQISPSPHLNFIGTQGGWTRSSTGYAFLAIQEAIDQLIQCSLPNKRIERWLDRIFLSYIKNHPSDAPILFAKLFEKSDPESLIRFLSGKCTLIETVKVISTLPKWSFIKEVFS